MDREPIESLAWISAGAGRAVVRTGDSYFAVDLDGSPKPCASSQLGNLLAFSQDITTIIADEYPFAEVRETLLDRWRKNRALTLLLMAVDASLSDDVRREASAIASELLENYAIRNHVRLRFLKTPLPEAADIASAPLADEIKSLLIAPGSPILAVDTDESTGEVLEGAGYRVAVVD